MQREKVRLVFMPVLWMHMQVRVEITVQKSWSLCVWVTYTVGAVPECAVQNGFQLFIMVKTAMLK